MDYETVDGSQFSLREVWTDDDEDPTFAYTSVSAYVDGGAYAGKLLAFAEEVDDADVLTCLEPVPVECIHLKFQEGFTIAPDFDSAMHYLKAPSFTYDDCQPGRTFVANRILNEVSVLERLKLDPHPNIVCYLGCVVRDGHVTHICLKKYPTTLVALAEKGLSEDEGKRILNGMHAGISHLHGLGLAHNDINPDNICVGYNGDPVIVDFDGCLPVGERLMKGTRLERGSNTGAPLSSKANDEITGMSAIQGFLSAHTIDSRAHDVDQSSCGGQTSGD